jgi:transcriptional regulator with XRE-family HTH domain
MARSQRPVKAWTPNQIVGYRVAQARLFRGWTQDEAARRLEPFLGTRWSAPSFSAVERSHLGGRIKQFTADEIVGLARGFGLPLGWFLTPPPRPEGVSIATPDAPRHGIDPMVMLDLVLGTVDTLDVWEKELAIWTGMQRRVRIDETGSLEDLGPMEEPVNDRLDQLLRLRAKLRLTEQFGGTTQARDVLAGLLELLDEVEAEAAVDEVEQTMPKAAKRRGVKR